MKNLRWYFMLGLALWVFAGTAQQLSPGFKKQEYQNLMYISARTSGGEEYIKKIPAPAGFERIYRSAPIGLDNLWEMWTSHQNTAVISLRGTTAKAESWLANLYAAMVPAQGKLEFRDSTPFDYQVASHPKAAVHVGWLLSLRYLSAEIIPKIKDQYQEGTKDFFIVGHSQGGAIAFLLTSYLHYLQQGGQLPLDIRFKTYCSAAPKPGNLYYAYDYEAMTQEGWAFNVVNAADWVPEVPMSIQTTKDFNAVNPFENASMMINKQKFLKRLALKYVYKKLDKPTLQAQKNYEKYLGKMTSKMIQDNLKDFIPPVYYHSNHYVRTGRTIVLMPDADYYTRYPNDPNMLFQHHFHQPYLDLLEDLPEIR